MKVLFLHPPWPGKGYGGRSQNRWPRKRGDRAGRYPLYLCYAATLLKEKGYSVQYIDSVRQGLSLEGTIDAVREAAPDAIFIETSTPTVNFDIGVVSQIRKALPKAKIIFAGTHATYFAKDVLKGSDADIVVRGELDFTSLNTLNALRDGGSLQKVKGITYKQDGKIVSNPDAPLIEDLDSLPFPDRSLIPHEWYIEGHAARKPFTFLITARGCPYKCSFCLWPNILFRRRVRNRSIENIIGEIMWLVEKHGIKEIFIDDGTFNVDKKRAIEFCKKLAEKKLDLKWGCSCRVNNIGEELLGWMKKSGCRIICYGPESASEETLKRTNKGITKQQMKDAIRLTRKAGIIAHANFMLGFPWETKEDMENTIRLAKELEPDTVQFSLVFPHPGTKMYEDAIKNGWFYDGIVGNWDRFEMSKGPVLKSKVSKDELVKAIGRGHREFFLRPTYIIRTLLKVRSLGELARIFRAARSMIKGKMLFKIEED